ncbi:MAG: PQQ-binding-like beta-propeller repeat protein [Chthoniobacteraceae bacterium]
MKRPILVLLSLLSVTHAADWAQWRGPNFNGTSPETGLPSKWSTTEGVKWSLDMPGVSGATPIVSGGLVFVMSPDADNKQWLIAVDRKTGKVAWKHNIADGALSKGRGNSTSPSPVTDGRTVWALVGTGQLAAFDFSGKEIWTRDLAKDYGKFNINWVYGSSPLLYGGKLYVLVLQRTPADGSYPGIEEADKGDRESYLLALDPAKGKTLWMHDRPTDAEQETQETYATPIPHTVGRKTQILIAGGDYLTGHDPESGAELWRGGGINNKKGLGGGGFMRLVPSAVAAGDIALVCGPKQSAAIAYRMDGHGDITEKSRAWVFDEKNTPDTCTPAAFAGKFYAFNGDKQTMTCLDAKTGAKVWQESFALDRSKGTEIFRASPTIADGKIYTIGERATAVVQNLADGKVIATIPMGGGDATRSSIAVSDGNLFIRTSEMLWCIGK